MAMLLGSCDCIASRKGERRVVIILKVRAATRERAAYLRVLSMRVGEGKQWAGGLEAMMKESRLMNLFGGIGRMIELLLQSIGPTCTELTSSRVDYMYFVKDGRRHTATRQPGMMLHGDILDSVDVRSSRLSYIWSFVRGMLANIVSCFRHLALQWHQVYFSASTLPS